MRCACHAPRRDAGRKNGGMRGWARLPWLESHGYLRALATRAQTAPMTLFSSSVPWFQPTSNNKVTKLQKSRHSSRGIRPSTATPGSFPCRLWRRSSPSGTGVPRSQGSRQPRILRAAISPHPQKKTQHGQRGPKRREEKGGGQRGEVHGAVSRGATNSMLRHLFYAKTSLRLTLPPFLRQSAFRKLFPENIVFPIWENLTLKELFCRFSSNTTISLLGKPA